MKGEEGSFENFLWGSGRGSRRISLISLISSLNVPIGSFDLGEFFFNNETYLTQGSEKI